MIHAKRRKTKKLVWLGDTGMASNADKTEETRNALIRSATEIISQKGYAKTTLEDIAKNINMTRGAFYWHFKNKQEILHEIETLYENQYLMDYGRFEILPSAYETLSRLIVHQIRDIFDDVHMSYAFIIRYRIEALSELPDLVEKQVRIDDFGIQQIAKQIERGMEGGEFRPDVDAQEAALGIFTFIVGVENVKLLHRGSNNLYQCDSFIRMGLALLDGLK